MRVNKQKGTNNLINLTTSIKKGKQTLLTFLYWLNDVLEHTNDGSRDHVVNKH